MIPISRKLIALASATVLSFGAAMPLSAQESGLSAGTPVDAEGNATGTAADNVGRAYTLETQGDWEIRCIKAPEGQADPCSMYQLLKDEQDNDVAEVALFHMGKGDVEAAATFTTPLETLLTGQLALFVDGQNGRKYPFQFCNKVGCFVRAGLTAADVDLLKKGNEGMVGIVPMGRPDQPVQLKLSLTGFTAAYSRVTELNVAAQGDAAPAE
ncbi:invasion associated locus B family protein [Celeribacter neptunius]|uniref:Invasion protein IalB, involved in pathogenesis n=1 Tax=Celeribacter neptunius TaxID=588602 RepID=A0A1I3LAN5_9RHOB|nr:invasion associated locus B family protein [Celeribacter neptunius]SFI81862.1 Invasion protein IalB, involved in pathogenesis [Celeribacter neptunius]